MAGTFFALCSKRLGLAAVGLLVTGGPVLAQQAETITLLAPHAATLQRQIIGRSFTGVPIEAVSLTRRVGYADLDLAKTSDADALRKRVYDTAKLACRQLEALSSAEGYQSARSCTKAAAAEAMAQVDLAIETARE